MMPPNIQYGNPSPFFAAGQVPQQPAATKGKQGSQEKKSDKKDSKKPKAEKGEKKYSPKKSDDETKK
jgi:hypothetical protein